MVPKGENGSFEIKYPSLPFIIDWSCYYMKSLSRLFPPVNVIEIVGKVDVVCVLDFHKCVLESILISHIAKLISMNGYCVLPIRTSTIWNIEIIY